MYGEEPAFEPDINNDIPVDIDYDEDQLKWWQIALIGLGVFLVTMIVARLITIKVMMKKIEDEI